MWKPKFERGKLDLSELPEKPALPMAVTNGLRALLVAHGHPALRAEVTGVDLLAALQALRRRHGARPQQQRALLEQHLPGLHRASRDLQKLDTDEVMNSIRSFGASALVRSIYF